MFRQCVQPCCGAVRPGVREEIKMYASAAGVFVHTHVPLCHSNFFTGVSSRVAGAMKGASEFTIRGQRSRPTVLANYMATVKHR